MTENKKERAEELFGNGCNCAQALLLAFAKDYGMDEKAAAAVSVPFGGGMSKQGKTCGCLTGALMVIGLCFGQDSNVILARRGEAYGMGKAFIEKFKEHFQATECRELIRLDLNRKEDLEEATKNVFGNRCRKMVGETAGLLEEFLKENLGKRQEN